MASAEQLPKTAEALGRIFERLESLDRRLDTAHKRIDACEVMIRDDIKEIRQALLPLRDWMNRGKGGVAVLVIAGSILSGIVASIITLWTQK